MPIAKFQLPDGRIAKFEVPEGTTPDEVTEYANQHFQVADNQNNVLENQTGDLIPLTKDMSKGMRRELDAQSIGIRQFGSDIGRFMGNEFGQPKSDYRQALDAKGNQLLQEKNNAKPFERLGGILLNSAEMAAFPSPAGFIPRIATNGLSGAMLGAAVPNAEAKDRASQMMDSAAINAVAPEFLNRTAVVAKRVGGFGKRVINPTAGALHELEGKFGAGNLPLELDLSQGARPPAGGVGPPTPRFGYVPGVEPTVGMLTNDSRIGELEKIARTRNGALFTPRDTANNAAVFNALKSRAIDDKAANELESQLNAQTGAIRNSAIANARGRNIADPLQKYVEILRTSPGPRADSETQKLAAEAERVLGLEGGAQPEDLYALRKMLDAKLASKGPSFDDLTAVTKNKRREVMGIKQAIDHGLNQESGGMWKDYLSKHAEGMKPIEEGRAFQDVINKFESKPLAPYGNGEPLITDHALRTALGKETYKNMGKKGMVDILSPQSRLVADDAQDVVSAINQAKKGAVAINGSNTASDLSSILKTGLQQAASKTSKYNPMFLINLADALGRTRGQSALDESLLDPVAFNRLLKEYHTSKAVSPEAAALARVLKFAPTAAMSR